MLVKAPLCGPGDKRIWIALVVAVLAIPLAIAFLDRPVATLAFSGLNAYRALFDALTHLVDPLPPLAILGLIVAALGGSMGRRAGPAARIAVTCCLAVTIVITFKDQAKYVFGRLWPETWVDNNPSWIGNGAYGFFPFHGGRGYASFPSGHTSVISAPAAVIWRTAPRLRPIAVVAVALVAIGLLGADYHFVSDIVAGVVTGTACGFGAVTLAGLDWRFGSEVSP